MSESSNKSLDYLLPQKAQEISDDFTELNKILTEYKNEIFNFLYIGDDFDSKISGKLSSIKQAIKPFHILQKGYEFIQSIEGAISRNDTNIFDDNWDILKRVFDPCNTKWNVFYNYELKSDYRLSECFKFEEKEAYKIIRDEIKNFLENKKKEWIEIWFSKAHYDNVDCRRIHISFRKNT